jgi:putative glutamine amidotransferase
MPYRDRRPLVGITCYIESASWGTWQDTPAALLPHAYVRAVTGAGARPVLLPPDDTDAGVLDVLDGLVLAGGADIDPARYGDDPHPETTGLRPERDAGELTLLGPALDRGVPVLGVCRGMQLMAVAAGGRLIQHMPDEVGHDTHRPGLGVYGVHGASFEPGSRIASVLGEFTEVNSYHHQGVADPGWLNVSGWADDGSIEAIEDPSQPFTLGVQWHPESTEDHRLFGALAEAAREYGAARKHSATRDYGESGARRLRARPAS